VADTVLKANYNATVAANDYDGPTVFAQNGVSSPYIDWAGQLNAAGDCSPTLAHALVPFPQYCGVLQGENEEHGNSIYNSFQGRIERHFKNGFYLLGSLTISKMYTDAAESVQSFIDYSGGQNKFSPFNIKPLRNLAEDNTPVTASVASVYALPFGRNERFLNVGGPISSFVSGWKVSLITRYEYGIPLSFYSSRLPAGHSSRPACPSSRTKRRKLQSKEWRSIHQPKRLRIGEQLLDLRLYRLWKGSDDNLRA
jgi:hypothetical protein